MIELKFTDLRSARRVQFLFTGEEVERGEFEAIKHHVNLRDVKEFRNGDYYIVHVDISDKNRVSVEAMPFYHACVITRKKRGLKLDEILEIRKAYM